METRKGTDGCLRSAVRDFPLAQERLRRDAMSLTHFYARTDECSATKKGDHWHAVKFGSEHIVRSDFMVARVDELRS